MLKNINFADKVGKSTPHEVLSGFAEVFRPQKYVKNRSLLNFDVMKVALLNFLVLTLFSPVMLYGAEDYSAQQRGAAPAQGRVTKVVIDPGHGGKAPGTTHGKTYEKDITLSIAKKLGALIERNLPDVKVIYTRTTDVDVPLHERSNIANRADADLFISIHINAVDNKPDVNGTSTFVMGNDKSGANLNVAIKENSVIKYEPNFETTYEGFVADDPASYIIFNLQQFANQDQSMMFAETVQKHFAKDMPLRDRGAYHGPFLVLWRTTMPSVLTEIGFMTNKKDRDYIATEKGQNEAARSLFNAFSEYKSRVEGRSSMVQLKTQAPDSNPLPDPVAEERPQQAAESRQQEQQQENARQVQFQGEYSTATTSSGGRVRTTLPDISSYFPPDEKPGGVVKHGTASDIRGTQPQGGERPVTQPAAPASQGQRASGLMQGSLTGANAEEAALIASQTHQAPQGTQQQTAQDTQQPSRSAHLSAGSGVLYYVQVSALDKSKSTSSPDFKSYRGKVIEKRSPRGLYKYMVGGVSSYDEARGILKQASREFPDAFIVAFDGDEQITVSQARERQRK